VIEALNLVVRKCAHLAEYGILGALLVRAIRASWLWWPERWIWWTAVSMAVSCASLDELRQAGGAARTGSPFDVLLDAVAAASGAALVLWRAAHLAGMREEHARRDAP
jgi:VanZ family protein